MAGKGKDREAPSRLRRALDIAAAPLDLVADFVVRPLLVTPAGRGRWPSADSPTGYKPSWRGYGKEPFWYPEAMRADLVEDVINGRYKRMRDRELSRVPLLDLAERKRISDAIELRRERDIEAYRKGGHDKVEQTPRMARDHEQQVRQREQERLAREAEARAKVAEAIGPAVHGYASAPPEARAQILSGLPPHVRDWLGNLPETALWEMKHVGAAACGRMAMGEGVLRGVPRCPQPGAPPEPAQGVQGLGAAPWVVGLTHAEWSAINARAAKVMAEGATGSAAAAEPPLRLISADGLMDGVTADMLAAFRGLDQAAVSKFIAEDAMRKPGQPETRIAGLTADQAKVVRGLHPKLVEKFEDWAARRPDADLGKYLKPEVLQRFVADANARARVESPVAGGLAVLAGVTPAMVEGLVRTGPDLVERFVREQEARVPGTPAGLLAGLTAEQVKVIRALGPEVVEQYLRNPEGHRGTDLAAAIAPALLASAIERVDRGIAPPAPAAAPVPASPAASAAPATRAPAPAVQAPVPASQPTPPAAQAGPVPDPEKEELLASIQAIEEAKLKQVSSFDVGSRRAVVMEGQRQREMAIMGLAWSRLEFPGLPAGWKLGDAMAGRYKDVTDIDFVSGVPPIGDAVQRYAAASPQERDAFRGMPPNVKAWLDGMPEESLRRIAGTEVSDVQKAALGVDAGIPGIEPCPFPAPTVSSPPPRAPRTRPSSQADLTVRAAVASSFGEEMTASLAAAPMAEATPINDALADILREVPPAPAPVPPPEPEHEVTSLDETLAKVLRQGLPATAVEEPATARQAADIVPLTEKISALKAANASAARIDPAVHEPEQEPVVGRDEKPTAEAPAAERPAPAAPASGATTEAPSVLGAVEEALKTAPKVSGGLLRDRIGSLAAKPPKSEPVFEEPEAKAAQPAAAQPDAVAAAISAKVKDAPSAGSSALRSRLNLATAPRRDREDPASFEPAAQADEDSAPVANAM